MNQENSYKKIFLQLLVLVVAGLVLSLLGNQKVRVTKEKPSSSSLVAISDLSEICGLPKQLKNPNAQLFMNCGGFLE